MRSIYFEPNQLKIEMDKMLLEQTDRIQVLCHSWGVKPIMEGNEIKGVFFESKEGRQAVLAKVVIDATGDGDLFSQAGAPYEKLTDAGCHGPGMADRRNRLECLHGLAECNPGRLPHDCQRAE